MTEISVVIPVWNEGDSIKQLYSELSEVLEGVGKTYEIVFIDDGSTDNSFRTLKEIHERDNRVKAIRLQRNFGKSAALSAGFRKALGDVVFTMDGDLQDDPKEIPKFLKRIDEGYDLVVGWKFKRKDPLTKRLPSKIFNKLTSLLTDVEVHDINCCFKAYRKRVIENIDVYGELHRYIPALVHWKGYKISEIKVNHRPRKHGKSKYGPMRLLKGFLDLITVKFLVSYAGRPLHLFGIMGILSSLIGFLLGMYLLYIKYFFGQLIGERPMLFAAILLVIVGIQFISMGLLGEMITSTHQSPGGGYLVKENLE